MIDDPLFPNLDSRLHEAIQYVWSTRGSQQDKQIQSGQVDAGSRGAVTAGGHLAALEGLVVEILINAELPDLVIHIGKPDAASKNKANGKKSKTERNLTLPGYYRPEKKWDMVVLSRGQLVGAIEFKTQVGSFGNNSNNRAEEAIGNAEDIWKAYREERFGTAPEPFLGYFFLLEDSPKVHTPIKNKEPFFEVDPIFKKVTKQSAGNKLSRSQGVSYSMRYEILCRRLKLERLYTATCLVLATKEPNTRITEPADDLTFRRFVAALVGHARTFVLSQ